MTGHTARAIRRVVLALGVVATSGVVLAGLRWGLGLPKPLALLVGGTGLAAIGLFALLAPRAGRIRAACLACSLMLALAAGLGTLRSLDRGGWAWQSVTGYDVAAEERHESEITHSPAEFVRRHPAFRLDPSDARHLQLGSGEYDIDETIVVPVGVRLTIAPGTVLRFAAGRSLVSYSPITARGTARAPVVFTAQTPWLKWGVVAVVDADGSIFEQVLVEHGRYATVNDVIFPGALSFIRADARVTDSTFSRLFGRDGMYALEATMLVRDNRFEGIAKDGLDLDGGGGEISRNRFVDCGDEGIDLSDNARVRVFDNTVLDRRGGRIEAEQNLDDILSRNILDFSTS